MNDIPLTAPAADRNKAAILAVLTQILPDRGLVLEIASGTGQHIVHFAEALPGLTWQPSDPDRTMRESIRAWIASVGHPNLRQPLDIDVRAEDWGIERADVVLCINMIHVAPFAVTADLMAGAARRLGDKGRLLIYGPFKRADQPLAPTNESFDALLRGQNLDWGLRDLEAVAAAAAVHRLTLSRTIDMPANNLMLLFEPKPAEAAKPEPPASIDTAPAADAGASLKIAPSLDPAPETKTFTPLPPRELPPPREPRPMREPRPWRDPPPVREPPLMREQPPAREALPLREPPALREPLPKRDPPPARESPPLTEPVPMRDTPQRSENRPLRDPPPPPPREPLTDHETRPLHEAPPMIETPPPIDDALLRWLVRAPNLNLSEASGPAQSSAPIQAAPPAAAAAAPPSAEPGIPLMITRGQRALLMELGFTQAEIRLMTPTEAHAHLNAKPR